VMTMADRRIFGSMRKDPGRLPEIWGGVFLMYGKVISACISGVEGRVVQVEVDIANGLPSFHIVGLPDSSVRESMERVRSALRNSGFDFPMRRITVNLAPADVRKEGAALDLAIACGILTASGQASMDRLKDAVILGELSLDGAVRTVAGVLAIAHDISRLGYRRIIVPAGNAAEAALIGRLEVIPVASLRQMAKPEKLTVSKDLPGDGIDVDDARPESPPKKSPPEKQPDQTEDYADVRGQLQAKRAIVIAAAGMHNILLVGPPGCGKTMLMRRIPTILPPLDEEEALEVTKIRSIAGLLKDRIRLADRRPFRAPHHSITLSGMVGGGFHPKPGEISLAHRGVLYLDELPEFSRSVLEALRQPLEDRQLTISRAKAAYTFPADILLAASMNPCPCGFWGSQDDRRPCTCTPLQIQKYRSRLSGPLLDRIDMQVEVAPATFGELANHGADQESASRPTDHQHAEPSSSAGMREQVLKAQERQRHRFRRMPGIRFNSQLSGTALRQFCLLDKEAAAMLRLSFDALGLSARAYERILKVARTIADLEGSEDIHAHHVAEAVQYRCLDRRLPQ